MQCTKLHLIARIGLLASLMATMSLSAQTTVPATDYLTEDEIARQQAAKSSGLEVIEKKTKQYTSEIEIRRNTGFTDYYDPNAQSYDAYQDGELGSRTQLRRWKLNK